MNISTPKSSQLVKLQAILFLVFLIVTFYFNRFAADDYHFIGELNNKSFQEIYQHLYFKWHGRWSSNFLLLAFLQFRNTPYFLLLYGLLTLGVLYIGIMRLLQSINQYINLASTQLKTYSLLLIGTLFFCTINPNETWFWYTSSIVYFWSAIAFVYALGNYFKPQKKWWNYLIYAIVLAYIGGSNEPLALFIILLSIISLLKKKQALFSLIGLLAIISALSVNYLSPGTLHRDEITTGLSLKNLILYTGYGSLKYLFFQLHTTFLPAILFSVPFYYLGRKTDYTCSNTFKPIPELFYSILIIGLVVVFNQLVVIYALGGLPPDRATITSSMVITTLLVRYLFLLGNHQKSKDIKFLLYFNVVGLFIFNILFFNIHYQYAKSVDKRMNTIKEKSKLNGPIKLRALPTSGYIYHRELKTDAEYFINQHLKKGCRVENDIVLKEN